MPTAPVTSSLSASNNILASMDDSKRTFYDREYIEKLYVSYQENVVDDNDAKKELIELLLNRKILILAPGKSLLTEKDKIKQYWKNENPIVISVNFITDIIPVDIAFVGNLKRFTSIAQLIDDNKNLKKVIVTSNIKFKNVEKTLTVNYGDYITDDPIITDNSGIMLLNLMQKLGVKDVALAGFDGFTVNRMDNYYNDSLVNSASLDELLSRSNAIANHLQSLKQVMNIDFITDSMYRE